MVYTSSNNMKTMNLEELKEWLKDAVIVYSNGEWEESGNYYGEEVYQKDGKLYRLGIYKDGWGKDHFVEKWGEKGYVRGVYEPIPVKRYSEMIEKVWYEPIEAEKLDNKM